MNISKQTAPPPPVYKPDDAGGPRSSGAGARPTRAQGEVCFVWIRASEIPLHICPITAHQHQAEARKQRGVHLSLFDSMFNDRLTKGLQMRAGVISPSSRLPLQCKRAYCASPDHNLISLNTNEEIRSVSESSRKLGRFCCFCSNWKRFW